jgi:tetratricopeptide (TPR) repeat protein
MNNMLRGRAAKALIMALLSTIILGFGCGKKEEAPAPVADERAINEYSHESVFEETYHKVQANPKDADALYHLADLYDRQGHYQEAVDTFKKVIELDPNRAFAYFKMGTAYSRMNQPEKAVEVLRQAAERLPKSPVVLNNLGIAYGKMNRLDEEIVAFKKALEIRPRYSAARFNLALTYLKQGDRQSAQAQYEALKEYDVTMAAELMKRIGAGK